MKGKVILIIFLMASLSCVNGQVHPISASLQLYSPSIYLSDYISPGSEKLVAFLTLNDRSFDFFDVRLRITIKGPGVELSSKPDFFVYPLTLQASVPLRVTGSDIFEYFQAQNLQFSGLTRQEFEKRGTMLPEGFYQFTLQAYDTRRTNVPLSGLATFSAYLMLNDPPLLLLPTATSKPRALPAQNMMFSWQSMKRGTNSFLQTEYLFQLYEMRIHNNPISGAKVSL